MKFMRPIVTDRPMLMMNNSAPYAMPSNRTPMTLLTLRSVLLRLLARVLEVLELVELDVPQFSVALLHPAHVDGLHDVARFRIDADRTPRTGGLVGLQDIHCLVG